MTLEDDIGRFLQETYGYRAHVAGRGGNPTLFGEVAQLLTSIGYRGNTKDSLGKMEMFNHDSKTLEGGLTHPKELAELLARTFLLGRNYDFVIDENSKRSGLSEKIASLWVVWLAEAEAKVAKKIPYDMRRPFLEAAISHWRVGGDTNIFGDSAFKSQIYHHNFASGYYELFLVMSQAPVNERREVLDYALFHALEATEVTSTKRYGKPSDSPFDHEIIARITYNLVLLKLAEGAQSLEEINRLTEILIRHKGRSIVPDGGPVNFYVNQTGTFFVKGIVDYANGKKEMAKNDLTAGIANLQQLVSKFCESPLFGNVRPLDTLFSQVSDVFSACAAAERLNELQLVSGSSRALQEDARYIIDNVSLVKNLDSIFKRAAGKTFRFSDYRFAPRSKLMEIVGLGNDALFIAEVTKLTRLQKTMVVFAFGKEIPYQDSLPVTA